MKKKMSIVFLLSGILLYGMLVITDYFIKFPSMLYFMLAFLCTLITISGIVIYLTKKEDNIYFNTTSKTKKKLMSILMMKK